LGSHCLGSHGSSFPLPATRSLSAHSHTSAVAVLLHCHLTPPSWVHCHCLPSSLSLDSTPASASFLQVPPICSGSYHCLRLDYGLGCTVRHYYTSLHAYRLPALSLHTFTPVPHLLTSAIWMVFGFHRSHRRIYPRLRITTAAFRLLCGYTTAHTSTSGFVTFSHTHTYSSPGFTPLIHTFLRSFVCIFILPR